MTRRVSALLMVSVALGLSAVAQGHPPVFATHDPGIYVVKSGDALLKLTMLYANDFRTKGMGKSILTQGFSKPSMEVHVRGANADLRIAAGQTTFFIYLDLKAAQNNQRMTPAQAMANMNQEQMPPQAKTASDFALIQFKPGDDERIGDLGKAGSNKPKDAVVLVVEKVDTGEFKLQTRDPLEPGEYAFTLVGGGMGGQLWDFGVGAKPH